MEITFKNKKHKVLVFSLLVMLAFSPLAAVVLRGTPNFSEAGNTIESANTEIQQDEAEIEPGGTLDLRIESELSPGNPLYSNSAYNQIIYGMYYETFVRTNPADVFTREHALPVIVKQYPSKEEFNGTVELNNGTEVYVDGVKWSIELRENYLWTDGQELTADDVVFTYSLIRWLTYYGYSEVWADILDIPNWVTTKKTGKYTADIYLNATGYLRTMYGVTYAQPQIFPEHVFGQPSTFGITDVEGTFNKSNWRYGATWVENPMNVTQQEDATNDYLGYVPQGPEDDLFIGTGPFYQTYWDADSIDDVRTVIMERNPNYYWSPYDNEGNIVHEWKKPEDCWNESEPEKAYLYGPYVDRLKFRIIEEDAAATAATMDGQLDMSAHRGQARYITQLKDAGLTTVQTPYLGFNHLSFNTGMLNRTQFPAPGATWFTGDRVFRQAVAYATDKHESVDNAMDGYGIPIDDPIPPSYPDIWGWDAQEELGVSHADPQPETARNMLVNHFDRLETQEQEGETVIWDTIEDEQFTFSILYTDVPLVRNRLSGVFSGLEEAGVKVERIGTSFPELLARLAAGDFQATCFAYVLGPIPTFIQSFQSTSGTNQFAWRFLNSTLDSSINSFFDAPTQTEASTACKTAQQVLFQQQPMMPIYQNILISAYWGDEWKGIVNQYGIGVTQINTYTKAALIPTEVEAPIATGFGRKHGETLKGSVTIRATFSTQANVSSARITVLGSGKWEDVENYEFSAEVGRTWVFDWNHTIDTTQYEDGDRSILLRVEDVAGTTYDFVWHVTIDNEPEGALIQTAAIGIIPAVIVGVVVYVVMRRRVKPVE